MADFYEMEEQKADQQAMQQKLHNALRHYDLLAREDEGDFQSKIDKITEYLGDFPPVKLIEEVFKHYKAKINSLTLGEIPAILEELGVTELKTQDGRKVQLMETVSVSVKNKPLLLKWLETNGEGDSLKTTIELSKGEAIEELEEWLNESGYSYKSKFDIHAQTRDKIIRERIKEGEELPPEDVATINIFNIARIK